MGQWFCFLACAALLTWVLTRVVMHFALQRALLDIPNVRSSHSIPTLRGGGLAIAGVVLAGGIIVGWLLALPWEFSLAWLSGSLVIAAVGWQDDRYGVRPGKRALVHLAAAVAVTAALGGLPQIQFGARTLSWGLTGSVLAVVGIVWFLNLYNFMDGIDGIASVQAITMGGFGGALLWWQGESGLALLSFLVAAACTGFLWWNWMPAKIFMGDVGSGLLGFQLASLAVASERNASVPLVVWGILGGVFIVDATATLFRRVLNGERWYEAHRSHAYQRAVQSGFSHARVTTAVLLINVCLGVMAWFAVIHPPWRLPIFLVALGGLGGIYLWIEKRMPMYESRRGLPL